MAATERALRRHAPARAQAVPTVVHSVPRGRPRRARGPRARTRSRTLDARFLYYKESDGRTQVINPLISSTRTSATAWRRARPPPRVRLDLGRLAHRRLPVRRRHDLGLGVHERGGIFPLATYKDQRKSVAPGLRRGSSGRTCRPSTSPTRRRTTTRPASFGLSDAWTFAGGRGTLHVGASISRDIVTPVTNNLEHDEDSERLRPRMDLDPRRSGTSSTSRPRS